MGNRILPRLFAVLRAIAAVVGAAAVVAAAFLVGRATAGRQGRDPGDAGSTDSGGPSTGEVRRENRTARQKLKDAKADFDKLFRP